MLSLLEPRGLLRGGNTVGVELEFGFKNKERVGDTGSFSSLAARNSQALKIRHLPMKSTENNNNPPPPKTKQQNDFPSLGVEQT